MSFVVDLNTLVKIGILLMFVCHFGVGVYSIIRNPRSSVIRAWFFLCIAVGIWAGVLFVLIIRSWTEQQAVFYSQLLHLGASFIPIFFFHFIILLIQARTFKFNLILIVGYLMAVIFAGLSFTPAIVVHAQPFFGFDQWVAAGPLYPLLLVYFWIYALTSLVLLFRAYRRSDGVLRKKYFYIFIAGLIGFGAGGTNFLPQTLGIYPYGNLIMWLDPLLITYGIFVE